MGERRSAKQEARAALEQARMTLAGDLSPVQRTITRGLIDYALEQLERIEETKRPRRKERSAEASVRTARLGVA